MIAEGKTAMFFQPWLVILPGIVLFVLVIAINLMGDGIRDVTAPDSGTSDGRRALPRGARPVGRHPDCAQGDLHAVRDIDFSLEKGETLGIVGESGSGKSMTALALMGLLPAAARGAPRRLSLGGRGPAGLQRAGHGSTHARRARRR